MPALRHALAARAGRGRRNHKPTRAPRRRDAHGCMAREPRRWLHPAARMKRSGSSVTPRAAANPHAHALLACPPSRRSSANPRASCKCCAPATVERTDSLARQRPCPSLRLEAAWSRRSPHLVAHSYSLRRRFCHSLGPALKQRMRLDTCHLTCPRRLSHHMRAPHASSACTHSLHNTLAC